MLNHSLLYPVNNRCRTARTLDGLWKFQFDPTGCCAAQGWQKGLPDPI